MKPLVSVIIPTYNRENYLADAIDSVLTQTFQSFELIIIDDGSTDATPEIVGNYGPKIRYHYQDNQGISASRNKGIELAKCQYIAFLDSDDLWVHDKLAQQVHNIQKENKPDIVFGYASEFISPEISQDEKLKLHCSSDPQPWYTSQTMLINRDVFDRVGVFDNQFTEGSFVEWYVRAKNHDLKIELLEAVVCKRRIHFSNYGMTNPDSFSEYTKIVKKYLNNKRGRKSK